MELLENRKRNKHAIELIDRKQPSYCLSPVELEILMAYIETFLKTRFIFPFKSPTGALIFFDKKPGDSFCLCVDYQSLNNLTIKNWYPFPLIRETLNCLGRAKQFTQLDLTGIYHRMRI